MRGAVSGSLGKLTGGVSGAGKMEEPGQGRDVGGEEGADSELLRKLGGERISGNRGTFQRGGRQQRNVSPVVPESSWQAGGWGVGLHKTQLR